jgi:hypothetical protein
MSLAARGIGTFFADRVDTFFLAMPKRTCESRQRALSNPRHRSEHFS